MLPGERHKVVVGDLVRADHFVGAYDSIFTAQIVRNKTMPLIREKSAEDAKGLVGRHAVAEQRMRGHPGEPKLRNRTGGEVFDVAQPRASRVVMLMVFPEQCHEQVDVE